MAKLLIVLFMTMIGGCSVFDYNEFVHSDTAKRLHIDNEPTEEEIRNGKILYEHIVAPLKNRYPKLVITSAFRNHPLNEAVGGVHNSQHTKGQAIDFIVPRIDHKNVVKWIRKNLTYDQLILEPGWIHISYVEEGNRNEYLIIK